MNRKSLMKISQKIVEEIKTEVKQGKYKSSFDVISLKEYEKFKSEIKSGEKELEEAHGIQDMQQYWEEYTFKKNLAAEFEKRYFLGDPRLTISLAMLLSGHGESFERCAYVYIKLIPILMDKSKIHALAFQSMNMLFQVSFEHHLLIIGDMGERKEGSSLTLEDFHNLNDELIVIDPIQHIVCKPSEFIKSASAFFQSCSVEEVLYHKNLSLSRERGLKIPIHMSEVNELKNILKRLSKEMVFSVEDKRKKMKELIDKYMEEMDRYFKPIELLPNLPEQLLSLTAEHQKIEKKIEIYHTCVKSWAKKSSEIINPSMKSFQDQKDTVIPSTLKEELTKEVLKNYQHQLLIFRKKIEKFDVEEVANKIINLMDIHVRLKKILKNCRDDLDSEISSYLVKIKEVEKINEEKNKSLKDKNEEKPLSPLSNKNSVPLLPAEFKKASLLFENSYKEYVRKFKDCQSNNEQLLKLSEKLGITPYKSSLLEYDYTKIDDPYNMQSQFLKLTVTEDNLKKIEEFNKIMQEKTKAIEEETNLIKAQINTAHKNIQKQFTQQQVLEKKLNQQRKPQANKSRKKVKSKGQIKALDLNGINQPSVDVKDPLEGPSLFAPAGIQKSFLSLKAKPQNIKQESKKENKKENKSSSETMVKRLEIALDIYNNLLEEFNKKNPLNVELKEEDDQAIVFSLKALLLELALLCPLGLNFREKRKFRNSVLYDLDNIISDMNIPGLLSALKEYVNWINPVTLEVKKNNNTNSTLLNSLGKITLHDRNEEFEKFNQDYYRGQAIKLNEIESSNIINKTEFLSDKIKLFVQNSLTNQLRTFRNKGWSQEFFPLKQSEYEEMIRFRHPEVGENLLSFPQKMKKQF